MIDHYELVQQLTCSPLSRLDKQRHLNDFAAELGWIPSDQLQLPWMNDFASAHLIVEHGLENTAVISFLRHPHRFPELNSSQQKLLVNASYNNLVDWHLNIDYDGVSFVYNRLDPPKFQVRRDLISKAEVGKLSSGAFETLASQRVNPSIPALDDALVSTISLWKRRLAADIPSLSNYALSALFNAIIFARATEDQIRNRQMHAPNGVPPALPARFLLELITTASEPPLTLLTRAFATLAADVDLDSLVDRDELRAFDALDPLILTELLSDFYRNKYARYYEYDFSLMSRHALSRIYEHYVSELRTVSESPQARLFPALPEERLERTYGNVYTPEFIARFFVKYLRKQLPLGTFQKLKVADPACGSGIFLRTALELQHDALFDNLTTESLERMFANVLGLDVDANACHAAKLSLSLLGLVLMDKFPGAVNIIQAESVQYFSEHHEIDGTMDAVIANPPFVTVEGQATALKQRVTEVLGATGKGRTDLYLAILKLSLAILKPGGFGLFVLPQNFLIAESARGMRQFLLEQAWIHCLVDLSAVRVFENIGVYVVLLVFQKKTSAPQLAPAAIIARCQDLVGQALERVLEGQSAESSFYSVYEVDQSVFSSSEWTILPPHSAAIQRKFGVLTELGTVAELRQGIISGADEVFIIPRDMVPHGEAAVFVAFLPDREMEVYTVPTMVQRCFFYPYINGKHIDEPTLREQFPLTWRYLEGNKNKLEARRTVKTKGVPWWRPSWPREPKNLLRPKIITPHLVIAPRFALDAAGKLAVSHSPLVFSRSRSGAEGDQLRYLLAVLNSTACFWYISQHSHSYQRGYSRLEMRTLSSTRIPHPSSIDRRLLRKLIRLVDERLGATGAAAFTLEEQIDDIIADVYDLSSEERRLVGMESPLK